MSHTAALGQLIQQLDTDTTVQDAFRSDPAGAVAGFEMTDHERDAVLTRDLDDLVAIGAAPSIDALPEVLRGTRADGPHLNLPDHLLDRLDRIRNRLPDLLGRNPRPDIPRVPPQPEPGPSPGPNPGPRPGPDPTPDG